MIDKNGNVKELVEEKMVVIPADFRAQKYWLNNRNPDRWKERVELEHKGMGNVCVELTDQLSEEAN